MLLRDKKAKSVFSKKSLYGLKQSPRAWFELFSRVVLKYRFRRCYADHTVFVKRRNMKMVILVVYVDDIVVTGSDIDEISKLKDLLKEFDIKDLRLLKYFLGIEVARSKAGIVISQRKYTLDLLVETGKLGRSQQKPHWSMITTSHWKQRVFQDKRMYQQLVGKLIYLTLNLIFLMLIVWLVNLCMLRELIISLIGYDLRYLEGSPSQGILYSSHGHATAMAYTDADWVGSLTERKSTKGCCTMVGGNLFS